MLKHSLLKIFINPNLSVDKNLIYGIWFSLLFPTPPKGSSFLTLTLTLSLIQRATALLQLPRKTHQQISLPISPNCHC